FIGLPGTFTALGAVGVLGTLWPVSDAATALLMAKFYELHMGSGLPPPTAFRLAQLSLRQATNAELNTYATTAASQGRLEGRHVSEIEQELSERSVSRNNSAIEAFARTQRTGDKEKANTSAQVSRPYEHPYFWGGFVYTGL